MQFDPSLADAFSSLKRTDQTGVGLDAARGRPIDDATLDAVASREGLTPQQARIWRDGILAQESGKGANQATSVNGARGAGQIIPDTFRRFARTGESIDNPADNLAVSARIVKRLADQHGDDASRIATGYFSGEGNVNAGAGQAWKNDAADGNGKRVSSYVSDINRRLGLDQTQAQAPGLPDLNKAPKWTDVAAKAEFKALPSAEQAKVKEAYFDYWIAPHAGGERDSLRTQFLSTAAAAKPSNERRPATPGLGSVDPIFEDMAATGARPYVTPTSVMEELDGKTLAPPPGVTPSLAPMTADRRAAIERAYNAATPEQRQRMAQQPGMVGQYVNELNQRYARIDEAGSKTIAKLDPRAEARSRRLAVEGGLDPEIAARMGPTQALLGATPGQEIPGTIGASDVDFDLAKSFRETPGLNNPLTRGLAKGGVLLAKGAAGVGEAMADAAFGAGPGTRRTTAALRRTEEAIGESGDFLSRNLEGAIASITSQLPSLVGGAITGRAAVALAGMAVNSFGNEYSDGKALGLDPGASATRAGLFTAFELLGESLGLQGLVKTLSKAAKGIADPSEVAKFFASNLKREIPGELLTTTGQFLTDKVPGIGLNPEAGLAEYLRQVGDTIVQTVMQGGIMAGGTTGVARAAQFLQDGGVTPEGAFSAELDRSVKDSMWNRQAINEEVVRSMNPDGTIYVRPARITPDGRIDPSIESLLTPGDPSAPTKTADAIVEQMAAEAGVPIETLMPTATNRDEDDESVLRFAEIRYQELLDKRDGVDTTIATPDGLRIDTTQGAELSPAEADELAMLEQMRVDPAALRQFYGFTAPGAQTADEIEAQREREAIQAEGSMPLPTEVDDSDIPFGPGSAAVQPSENPFGTQAPEAQQAAQEGSAPTATGSATGAAPAGQPAGTPAGAAAPQVGTSAAPPAEVAAPPVRPEGDQPTGDAGAGQGDQGRTQGGVGATPREPVGGVGADSTVPGGQSEQDGALSDTTGFLSAFGGLKGGGATQDLVNKVFAALQEGKDTVAGVKDPILKRARPAFDAGLIKSPDDIRKFEAEGYPAVPPKTEKEAKERKADTESWDDFLDSFGREGPAASVTRRVDLPDGMQAHVFKTSDGFGTGLFDAESGNYVSGSITRFTGADAQDRANASADEMARKATPPKTEKQARERRQQPASGAPASAPATQQGANDGLRQQGQGRRQEAPDAVTQPAGGAGQLPPPQAKPNTIFTEDAAAAARARLKAKLGRLQSGIDPETMLDGITLAGYHIERGARRFAAYARAMVDDLGDAVKPYLVSWYLAVRNDPRAAGFKADMDKAGDVEDADIDALLAGQQEQKAPATPSIETPEGRARLAQEVADHLIGGNSFATINDARKFLQERIGSQIVPGTQRAKYVDEVVESGVVLAARAMVAAARKQGRSDDVIYKRLVSLYEAQPNLAVRDTTSIANQAYSTPIPLAFAASRLAGIGADTTVLEPTAGNGALLIEAAPANVTANELNPDRAATLAAQGITATVGDAMKADFPAKGVRTVIANPPFGKVREAKWTVGSLETAEIDHAISMKSLEAMADDGTAVLIIGGPMSLDDDARQQTYRGAAKRAFFKALYDAYNVTQHFTVAGDLYAKQGTKFPVDVIVIKGRGKSQRMLPAAQLPDVISTWDQLQERMNGTTTDSLGASRPGDSGRGAGGEGAAAQPGDVPAASGVPTEGSGRGGARGRPAAGVGSADGSGSDGSAAGTGEGRGADNREPGGDAATGQQANPGGGDAQKARAERPGSDGGDQRDQPDSVGVRTGQRSDRSFVDTTKLQVPYVNFSANRSVNTLVSTNHVTPIQNAFKALAERVGDIDEYVRTKLGYEPEQFKKSFSAEQVEALALAIDNVERGAGFIIGDQTGIGKGRVVAGMIRYAIRTGKTPVFVTQIPDLYGDMMRDLTAIGMGDIVPLMTNNNASVPLDAQALAWFDEKQNINTQINEIKEQMQNRALALLGPRVAGKTKREQELMVKEFLRTTKDSEIKAMREEAAQLRADIPERPQSGFLDTPDIKRHEEVLARMIEQNSIGRHQVIFTTYDQMNPLDSGKAKRDKDTGIKYQGPPKFAFRQQFLEHFINDKAMLIMDESHNAGAAKDADRDDGSTSRGDVVRSFVANAGSVFYSSATFAKNPASMDVYNRTDLGKAFSTATELLQTIKSVPVQQITSAMLVQAGQYLRRERSFDGIEYNITKVDVDVQPAEELARSMQAVVAFDTAKKAAIREMQRELDAEGATMDDAGGPNVDSTNFTDVMHNVVNTFLLALKARETVKFAVDAIRRGEKPVITVANTMETFITDFAEQTGKSIGDRIDGNFADVMLRYLEKVRTVRINYPDTRQVRHYMTDRELGPDALAAYEAAVETIEQMRVMIDLPLSPIDAIKQGIVDAGFSIGEITGRQTVLDKNNVLRKRNIGELNSAGKKNTIAKFNDGRIDALLINRSGSTGLSMHASETFEDQRRRVMIVAQAELDINNHMQMLGRINRTGQVTQDGLAPQGLAAVFGLPYYVQLVANVPIELRPAAVLSAKMASLNANTTAGRGSAVQDTNAPDFMNKYGDRVAAEVVGSDPELDMLLGFPLKVNGEGEILVEGTMARVTGRVGLLLPDKQTELYDLLQSEYTDLIKQLDALGQNDLEAKTVPLEAETKESEVVIAADADSISPFTAEVRAEKVEVKRLGKPYTKEQVLEQVTQALGGKTPAQVRKELMAEYEAAAQRAIEAVTNRPLTEGKEEAEERQKATEIGVINAAVAHFKERMPEIGKPFVLKTSTGNVYGVVTGITKPKKPGLALSGYKVRYAVLEGSKSMTFALSQLYTLAEADAASRRDSAVVAEPNQKMQVANEARTAFEWVDVIDAFDRMQTASQRETRYMVTGNILRGLEAFPGRLINYTTKDGSVQQGILMPANFDMAKQKRKLRTSFKTAEEAFKHLSAGGALVDKEKEGAVISVFRMGPGAYVIETSKSGIGKQIARELGPYFVSAGNRMRARDLSKDETIAALRRLMDKPYSIKLIAAKQAGADNIASPPVLDTTGIRDQKGRHPQVTAAARLLQAGQITREQYDAYVDLYKPIELVEPENLMAPTTDAKMQETVDAGKRDKVNVPVADGTRVGLRMDLPARERGGSVVSIHEGRPGKASAGRVISFRSTGWLKNVTFETRSQTKGLAVAMGEAKSPLQTIEGEWFNLSADEAFAKVKELMRDPQWRQVGFDPTRHGYFYDRATRRPVVSAAEVYQVGQFVLARDVQYAPQTDFLYDPMRALGAAPRPIPAPARADALARLKRLEQRLQDGKITLGEYRLGVQQVIGKLETRNAAQESRKQDRRTGADWIVAKLRRAAADGILLRNEADFAQWLLDQNPNLASDLSISVRAGGTGVSGNYNPFNRLVTLFTGAQGDGTTAVHEILHHTERMMPTEVQDALLAAWQSAWMRAHRNADDTLKDAMQDMLSAAYGDAKAKDRVISAFSDGTLNYEDHYQLYSPSEFWAVNATRILDARFRAQHSWARRAMQWLKEFVERVKGMLGLPSDAPVLRALKQVMQANGAFVSRDLLLDRDASMFLAEAGTEQKDPTEFAPEYNDIVRNVQQRVTKMFTSDPDQLKTFSWYDRTLSTQYNKALKDMDFGRVFNALNAMQNAVSLTAMRPAELAPGLMPKVDDVAVATNTLINLGVRQEDIKVAGEALFAGTLFGDSVLDGVVWTEMDFMARFNGTPQSWALYQQARNAVDASLDEVAAAEAYAIASGKLGESTRKLIMDDPAGARDLVVTRLKEYIVRINQAIAKAEINGDAGRIEILRQSREEVIDTLTKAQDVFRQARELKAAGYMPLMRFGKYKITVYQVDPVSRRKVRDEKGEAVTLYYGRYETKDEMYAARDRLRLEFVGDDSVMIEIGTHSESAHEMYQGVRPESVALFAEMFGKDDFVDKYYRAALSDRSALKRRLQRKGIEGYSPEIQRVLSSFITSNSRLASQRYYMRDVDRAIKRIPLAKGQVKDEAIALKAFVLDSRDKGAFASSLMFNWVLGGSVASVLVNLSQTPMVTLPYLSQYSNEAQAAAEIVSATKAIAPGGGGITDARLAEDMRRASLEGVVNAQEIFHLYAMGSASTATGLTRALSAIPGMRGVVAKNAPAVRMRTQAALTLWGAAFSAAEQINRKITFIAAWNTAVKQGMDNPYGFAVRAVNVTQGIYNKVNRPNFGRSTAGRIILVFRQYSLIYFELLKRMAMSGPAGRRAAALMIMMMILAAGFEGLPFMKAFDDLIDTIGQWMGYDTNSKLWKRRTARKIAGEFFGDLFLYGASAHLPFDFAGRLGLGSILPGTAIAKPSDSDRQLGSVLEIVGATSGLVRQVEDAAEASAQGNYGKAAVSLMPKAFKDLLTGVDWMSKGYATDAGGRRTVDLTTGEAGAKVIGFNPGPVARKSRETMPVEQDIRLQKVTEAAIVSDIARSIVDKDKELGDKARKRMAEWNKTNPESRIILTERQIRDRIRQMSATKDQRLLRATPPEMRGRVAADIAED
jgi:hypothetical protein